MFVDMLEHRAASHEKVCLTAGDLASDFLLCGHVVQKSTSDFCHRSTELNKVPIISLTIILLFHSRSFATGVFVCYTGQICAKRKSATCKIITAKFELNYEKSFNSQERVFWSKIDQTKRNNKIKKFFYKQFLS